MAGDIVIGQKIRSAIDAKGVTYEEAAYVIGISAPHLKNIMGGRKGASWEVMMNIRDYTGLSADDLLPSRTETTAKKIAIADVIESIRAMSEEDAEEVRRLARRLSGRKIN